VLIFTALALGGTSVMWLARDLATLRGVGTGVGTRNRGARVRRLPAWDLGRDPSRSRGTRVDRAFNRLAVESGAVWSPLAALMLILACGLAAGGAAFIWYDDLLAGLAAAPGGMLVGLLALLFWRARRLRNIQQQLPEVLDLLARAVRAGESLEQATDLVGREMAGPLGAEFRRVAQQLQMGLSINAVMRALARRVRLMEVRILATALMVHRRTGGNLPLTIDRLAGVVRDRLNYRRQFRAATAGGRFATVLITVIGPLVTLYMLTCQPEYIRSLLAQPLGWTLLGVAILMQVVGLSWIVGLLRTRY
jgi:tight adherence protein B